MLLAGGTWRAFENIIALFEVQWTVSCEKSDSAPEWKYKRRTEVRLHAHII